MTTNLATIFAALSAERMSTYESATRDTEHALQLYAWNAQISAAFMAPLHICEVVIRNAAADAISTVYGDRWPWSAPFLRSLPNPRGTIYKPRQDLFSVAGREQTTGKVIPELKFVFWEKMYTGRFDGALWSPYLLRVMPNFPTGTRASDGRNRVRAELGQIRALRNRIAHHEPIFTRQLANDYAVILDLVNLRCGDTAAWMDAHQSVAKLLQERP